MLLRFGLYTWQDCVDEKKAGGSGQPTPYVYYIG